MTINKLKLLAAGFIIASVIAYVYNQQKFTTLVILLNITGGIVYAISIYRESKK